MLIDEMERLARDEYEHECCAAHPALQPHRAYYENQALQTSETIRRHVKGATLANAKRYHEGP